MGQEKHGLVKFKIIQFPKSRSARLAGFHPISCIHQPSHCVSEIARHLHRWLLEPLPTQSLPLSPRGSVRIHEKATRGWGLGALSLRKAAWHALAAGRMQKAHCGRRHLEPSPP